MTWEKEMQIVMKKGFSNFEKHIVEMWYAIEEDDEDISTERLIAMTCDFTGASMDKVLDTMQKFSEKHNEYKANKKD